MTSSIVVEYIFRSRIRKICPSCEAGASFPIISLCVITTDSKLGYIYFFIYIREVGFRQTEAYLGQFLPEMCRHTGKSCKALILDLILCYICNEYKLVSHSALRNVPTVYTDTFIADSYSLSLKAYRRIGEEGHFFAIYPVVFFLGGLIGIYELNLFMFELGS